MKRTVAPRLGSSWSATEPVDREKHFRVVAIHRPRTPDEVATVLWFRTSIFTVVLFP